MPSLTDKFTSRPGVPIGVAGGRCYFCPNTKGVFVRTFTEIEYEGEIAICKPCAEAIGAAVGCGSKFQTMGLKRENARAREEAKELRARNAELEEIFRGLQRAQQVEVEEVSV